MCFNDLHYKDITNHQELISNLKPFADQYNLEKNKLLQYQNWQKFEKNNQNTALNKM